MIKKPCKIVTDLFGKHHIHDANNSVVIGNYHNITSMIHSDLELIELVCAKLNEQLEPPNLKPIGMVTMKLIDDQIQETIEETINFLKGFQHKKGCPKEAYYFSDKAREEQEKAECTCGKDKRINMLKDLIKPPSE